MTSKEPSPNAPFADRLAPLKLTLLTPPIPQSRMVKHSSVTVSRQPVLLPLPELDPAFVSELPEQEPDDPEVPGLPKPPELPEVPTLPELQLPELPL